MMHDLTIEGSAVAIGEGEHLDGEKATAVRGAGLDRPLHRTDDTHGWMDHENNSTDSAEPPERPIVRLMDVTKSFNGQAVLKDVSLSFARGATTVVMGPSGCGKTVMLKHIIGLIKPDDGEVWFEQERVDVLSERDLTPVRRQFGFLFQHGALFDSLSVRDNVAFPLVEHTDLSKQQRLERVRYVLSMVGLADALEKMPAELSGGQRKRIALARAIVLEPKVILYDEPTTGLDPIRAEVINELIQKLQRELHATSIVVTHDLTSAFRVAHHMVMLYDGEVVQTGEPEEFRDSDEPRVRQFIRGEAEGEATL
jgi:phospholipid/cholesterol/gamma-HCH transport system ATP-binding protein